MSVYRPTLSVFVLRLKHSHYARETFIDVLLISILFFYSFKLHELLTIITYNYNRIFTVFGVGGDIGMISEFFSVFKNLGRFLLIFQVDLNEIKHRNVLINTNQAI